MNLATSCIVGIFLFFIFFLAKWYDLTYPVTPNHRKIFEVWAEKRRLSLNDASSRYTCPQTQLAWEAFKCGLRTPR